jgi:fibronectin type 3 domain-containing protein
MKTNVSRRLLTVALVVCFAGCRQAAPHRVTLNWQPPVTVKGVTVVGYNVYRSTSPGGPFARLAARVAAPPYEDRLVNDGRTYYYVVTALDASGRESRYSGEIKIVIP